MKKILILIIGIFLFASTNEEFLDYTNKLVTYNFELKNFDKISSPFFKPRKLLFLKNKKINKRVQKFIHIRLISILNNMALIRIEEYKGDELIRKYKKWIKKGGKIEECRVKDIKTNKIILNCNHKLLIKKINEKRLKIRTEK
jgi:nanoRNase/pAp phosphatase (c-di-AMP/oligoRNAs hydrolase)